MTIPRWTGPPLILGAVCLRPHCFRFAIAGLALLIGLGVLARDPPRSRLAGRLSRRVSLDLRSLPLSELADLLRELTGLAVSLAPKLRQRNPAITLRLSETRLDEAIEELAARHGLSFERAPGRLRIQDRPR